MVSVFACCYSGVQEVGGRQARLGPYSEITWSIDERRRKRTLSLRIKLTEWSEGRGQRVPGSSWLRLKSEGGCVSPVRSEHNSEVGCAGEVRLIPELARGMLFSGLSPRSELPGAYSCATATKPSTVPGFRTLNT